FGKKSDEKEQATQLMILQTVEAVSDMAWSKTGALIVFETGDSMANIAATGTTVNADMTAELIKNVFYPKAPLHDGAVIVSNNRLQAAGCILPLSAKFDISKELGTRHRAALGVSEAHDCIVVVVSEETGAISFAKGGMLKRHLAPETLQRLLQQELMASNDAEDGKSIKSWLKGVLNK
ncbi:MAG: DNA integrity scanning protein DisA nucleotide-binding domain protein, partial [Clostridia bacterium]|nr:DNA integrity scanning protein DisA nucleotide-binding domain protein [Clostridia bacterium]